MDQAATAALIQADASDFSSRVGQIVASVMALVAHRLLRHPQFEPLLVPLWTRLNRASQRLQRLLALFAAGRLPKPRPPRPHRPGPDPAQTTTAQTTPARTTPARTTPARTTPARTTPAPGVRLPTGFAWLVRAIPYEAAAYGCQLEHLLAQPGMAELLAACPGAARILRPIAHMLGIRPPALTHHAAKPRAPRRRAQAEPPRAAPPPAPLPSLPPDHPCATYRPSAHWPAACRRRNNPA